jgi:3-hydroxyisobutyrate dehydrogenase
MPQNPQTTVAFLGTGTMGEPMARNLLTAGYQVRVWNRTRAKAEPLAADGATVVDSPAEAASGADILITMLIDSAATAEAGAAAAAELPETAVWVQMGTIGVAGLATVAGLAAERGLPLVDAPVLGTRAPAEQGKLIMLAAGAQAVRDRVQPLFDVLGERTQWLSDDAAQGAGTKLKLAVNSWVLALTNAVGESLAIADTLGVNPRYFLDTIKGTPTDSPYAHIKGAAILDNQYTPLFTVDGAHKDAQLISDAVDGQLRLDVADAVRERFRRAIEAGHGDKDMAAAYFASFDGQ